MGIIVNKENEKQSSLTRRIDVDLREKISSASKTTDEPTIDLVEEAEYAKNLKKTSRYGWVWVLLIIFGLIMLIALGMSFQNR